MKSYRSAKDISQCWLLILMFSFILQTAQAVVNVSGTVYVSSLEDNAELTLKGGTILNVDVDKTIKSISGSSALTIQGSKTLTVSNLEGNGIAVKSLECSASLNVTAYKDGLNVDEEINISGGPLYVNAVGEAVYSRKGNIIISCDVNCRSEKWRAIYAKAGDVTITGNITAKSSASNKACIQAGFVDNSGFCFKSLTIKGGTIDITSAHDAVCAYGTVNIAGIGKITTTSNKGRAIYAGKMDCTGIGGGVYGDGNITLDGTFNVSSGKYGIIANGSILLKDGGSLTTTGMILAQNDVTLNGNVDVTSPDKAIWARIGEVTVTGNLVAYTTSSDEPCIQAGYAGNSGAAKGRITLSGSTSRVTAHGNALVAYLDDMNLSGDVTAISTNGIGVFVRGLDATGIGGGIYLGDLNVNSGKLYAAGKNNAIICHGNINIASELSVMVPEEGTVGENFSIVDSNGEAASCVIIESPRLTGAVSIATMPAVGDEVEYNLRGLKLESIPASKFSAEWQISNDGETGWTAVSNKKTYTIPVTDLDKYLRVRITANGYEGYLTSSAVKVVKKQSTVTPEEPVLTVNKNNQIVVSNAKAEQEYIITTEKGFIPELRWYCHVIQVKGV